MSRLSLWLLGLPRLELDDLPLEFSNRKIIALLAYLAVTGQTYSRDTLATLFWPDSDQARARGALRNTLWTLNKGIGPGWLETDRETVKLVRQPGLWLDVVTFSQHLAACRTHGHSESQVCPACLPLLAEAVSLYWDRFMSGFTLRDSLSFDDWQHFEGERLAREMAGALERLVRGHSAQGAYELALGYGRRWLELDPLNEASHRQLMQVYAWAGEPAAALRQYQECVQLLRQELEAPPSPATVQLYEVIKNHQLAPPLPTLSPAPTLINLALENSSPSEPTPAPTLFLSPLTATPVEGAVLDEAISGPETRYESWLNPALPEGAQLLISAPSLTPHFVGRRAELAYYTERLLTFHLAIITGMAGVGKTSLALQLAQQVALPERICWHTFYEESGVGSLLWTLAAFLARHGRVELWQMLQSARQTGSQPPPLALVLDYLVHVLPGQGFVLCLDDIRTLQDNPALANLLDRLQPLLQEGQLVMIMTSRQVLNLRPALEFSPLNGLSQTDAAELLDRSGLRLPAELVTQLYQYTEGNVELLTLAIQILKQSRQPERVLARLAEADDIERYLIKEVDEQLGEAEREVMIGVAIFLGYPGTRDAIETVVERRRIKSLLRHLVDRHLLNSQEGQYDEEYSAHAMVQAFYYDVPGRRERQAMHHRAGEYYEREEPDLLRAVRHYELAGASGRAAELATADIWAIVNRGQARPLRHLLERLVTVPLDPELAIRVRLALGEIYIWLGKTGAARTYFQEALAQLELLPPTPARNVLKAKACQGIGGALQYEALPEALTWLQRGLQMLAGADLQQEAGLYIAIGRCQIDAGELAAALQSLQRGLDFLPSTPSRLRATALLNLGNVYANQGNLQQANSYTRQAAEISESLHDHFRLVPIWHNLGIDYESMGRWEEALGQYQQALAKAEQLGSIEHQIALTLSLGVLNMKQGHDEAAQAYLNRSRRLAEQYQSRTHLIWVNSSLADLYLRQGRAEAAAPLLAEAEQGARNLETQEPLPEIQREFAQLYLAQRDLALALSAVEAAIGLAAELEMKLEEGLSRRILGQIRLALAQPEAALTAFDGSLNLLSESGDPYEIARTQAAWGHALLAGSDQTQGLHLLELARTAFQRLGAQRDLAQVTQDLARP